MGCERIKGKDMRCDREVRVRARMREVSVRVRLSGDREG